MNGRLLNGFFVVEIFDEEKEYQVCSNMADRLKEYVPPKRKHTTRSGGDGTIEESEKRRRAEQPESVGERGDVVQKRISRRLHPSAMLYNNSFRSLKIMLDSDVYDNIDYNTIAERSTIDDDADNNSTEVGNNNENNKEKRRSKFDVMLDDLLEESSQYYMGYNTLKTTEKKRRTSKICNKILAACLDRKELRKDGLNYLRKNGQLAADVVMLLDAVKNRLQ